MDALLPSLLGCATGLLMGLTGAGGGVLAVPLLMLVLHLPPAAAAPVSLMAVAIGAGYGALIGLYAGIVRYRAALLMAAAGMLASPLGILLARRLPVSWISVCFALLLGVQAWRMARGRAELLAGEYRPCDVDASTGRFIWNRPCARALAGAGLLTGFFSGLLGVGGGFVLVPALRRHTPLTMVSITATSLAVLTLVALGGLAQWAAQGAIPWALALPFVAGTVLGVAGGRTLAPHLPERRLREMFAALCAATAVAVAVKAWAA
ncbi:MAG: sulfite exporter TauE/SafE family protein [Rhodocyclaceae bacterium]|nr:sulfite exporter TauE/SafE family protein [Rhodocyclaceae bacterium]